MKELLDHQIPIHYTESYLRVFHLEMTGTNVKLLL